MRFITASLVFARDTERKVGFRLLLQQGKRQQPPYPLALPTTVSLFPSGPLQDEEMQSPGGWKCLCRSAFVLSHAMLLRFAL